MSNKVYRVFKIENQKHEEKEVTVLHMISTTEGNFGPIRIHSWIDLDEAGIHQLVTELSGEPLASIFQFRLDEMQYLLQVSHLFNPINQKDYGIQETSEES